MTYSLVLLVTDKLGLKKKIGFSLASLPTTLIVIRMHTANLKQVVPQKSKLQYPNYETKMHHGLISCIIIALRDSTACICYLSRILDFHVQMCY